MPPNAPPPSIFYALLRIAYLCRPTEAIDLGSDRVCFGPERAGFEPQTAALRRPTIEQHSPRIFQTVNANNRKTNIHVIATIANGTSLPSKRKMDNRRFLWVTGKSSLHFRTNVPIHVLRLRNFLSVSCSKYIQLSAVQKAHWKASPMLCNRLYSAHCTSYSRLLWDTHQPGLSPKTSRENAFCFLITLQYIHLKSAVFSILCRYNRTTSKDVLAKVSR